jgi:hypothetical protein
MPNPCSQSENFPFYQLVVLLLTICPAPTTPNFFTSAAPMLEVILRLKVRDAIAALWREMDLLQSVRNMASTLFSFLFMGHLTLVIHLKLLPSDKQVKRNLKMARASGGLSSALMT